MIWICLAFALIVGSAGIEPECNLKQGIKVLALYLYFYQLLYCYNRGSGLNQRLNCPKRLVSTLANWQQTTVPGSLFGKVKALVNCSDQRTVLSSAIVVLVDNNPVFCQWVGLLFYYINSVKSGSKQALVLQPILHTMTTKPRLSTCLTLTRIAARPSFHS